VVAEDETPKRRRDQKTVTTDYGCKPNMRTITSMIGVDAVKVSSQVHMLRTMSVISIPVMDKTTTMTKRLKTFQIE